MNDDWDSHHTMLELNYLTSFVEYKNFLGWCYIYPLINSNGHTTTDSTCDHNIGLSSDSSDSSDL